MAAVTEQVTAKAGLHFGTEPLFCNMFEAM